MTKNKTSNSKLSSQRIGIKKQSSGTAKQGVGVRSKTFVLSLGGSLLVNEDGLDLKFLKSFRNFIIRQTAKDYKFYLVVGGGLTARRYIQAALKAAPVSARERDWVGIKATALNAELVRVIFGPLAYPQVINDPTKKLNSRGLLVIAAGYQPGFSTDHVAVLLAKHNKLDGLINLSNIDFVYEQDPRRFPEAKKFKNLSWPEFRGLVGNRWRPGLNVPFDPVASREAQQHGLQVTVLHGKRLKNLEACLDGKDFKGTRIA